MMTPSHILVSWFVTFSMLCCAECFVCRETGVVRGSMDVTLLSIIIEKGLIKSGRKMKLTVTLIDKPGTLMQLTRMLQDLNANIVHIEYDRTSTSLAYGDANVTIHLETKGEVHQQQIRAALKENRYLSSEEL